ncbi:sugar transferase [Catellatospora sp. KI3]|uniref:sugar transferase n=1 Tax=Catellatospora sp. KI3 TaxID=3041620 RepID=UPI0024831E7E|nr:sugar transferase [Catellatospora sp. KI3]MDI1460668.1 sugar transferase [Catellatospora sp. KI3]
MSVNVILASLLPGLCMALSVGSRLGGRVPHWLARFVFFVTVVVASTIVCWTYAHLHQRTTALLVTSLFVYSLVFTITLRGLAEDNAPPSAAVRRQILARHAHLLYPREPRGKRAFDIAAAAVGILLTLPLWFVLALWIWLEEPGPIFFVKNSVGRGGVVFREVKFRSMRHGAEHTTGPVVASHNDSRTLLVGRVMRPWHLDELPELLNVLTGAMSVVGPRPLRAVVVRHDLDQVPGFAVRHTVRPGIACTAQIEKCHVPAAERLSKDLGYIQQMSLGVDLRMLVRAVVSTARGEREAAPQAVTPAMSAITTAPPPRHATAPITPPRQVVGVATDR